ncbi:MAG TPA: hypothetical protein VJU84_02380 [Pyrinomonadaceae bacterium]|nr:hypothetical protein [Pyrinomonadaceae bacterium]
MNKVGLTTRLGLLVILALLQLACPQNEQRMRRIGPDVKASVVIYFNLGVSNKQVDDFWQEVLSKPDPAGRGHYHRNGVGDIGRITPVQGHEGISISFLPDATEQVREEVIKDIEASPLVYKVLRDVAPAEIKKL